MIAFIVLLIINLMILMNTGAAAAAGPTKMKGDWTVYGTMGCSWTRKQLEHMKKKGISHTFVDCDEEGACPGMDAYPTMKSPNGEKVVGFKEV